MNGNLSQSKDHRKEISGFIIERTAKKMKQRFKRILKEQGAEVTVDQWIILQELEKTDGLSQFEIAARTFKDAPTVTRIIDLLCAKKLTERIADPEDRRKFNIYLTQDGKLKINEILPMVQFFRSEAWDGLNVDEMNQLTGILNTIFNNLK